MDKIVNNSKEHTDTRRRRRRQQQQQQQPFNDRLPRKSRCKSRRQNSQKHWPNIPPSLSSNSSQALPTFPPSCCL